MRLAEFPDRADDLRQRLKAAEARAHTAEMAAQKAKASLAKTVLDAARVEAEANEARSKAKMTLERENNDLRSELVKARKMVSALEGELAQVQRAAASQAAPGRSEPGEGEMAPPVVLPSEPADSCIAGGPQVGRARGRDAAVMAVSAAVLCVGLIFYPHAVGVPTDQGDRSLPPLASSAAVHDPPLAKPVGSSIETVQQVSAQTRTGLPTIAVNADRRARGSWLLWMPIQRPAIEESLRRAPRPAGDMSQATRSTRWAP
ncbi:MAG: hypothetical protein MJE12_08045 [Alphaproteobacteria bacterium]|nr:hypothetical protein [Alphaproteobacteria bacterium]